MRLLVDSGNYFSDNDNLGDRAVYRIIVRRLRHLWPDSEIRWITRNAELLRATCPEVFPLELTEARHPLLGLPMNRTPDEVPPQRLLGRAGREAEPHPAADAERILSALRDCELVLATGGGYFSDCFADHAWTVLDTLEASVRFGKPAVILSCGFEPIRHPSLSEKMLTVLPQLNLITCREPLQSPAVVRSFGAAEQRVIVAGDDAVELAFDARPPVLGNGLGVNLRQANYAGVNAGVIARLRECLHQVADRLAAPLVPVPISLSGPSDQDAIRALLEGFADDTDDGHHLNKPEEMVRQVGHCRLAVVGSYHAAVFALSQGISVVALAASPHYRAKLHGLQSQFGAGCCVVSLDCNETNEGLAAAIEEGWRRAESERPGLLRAAQHQITASRAAYERVHDLVEPVQAGGRRRSGLQSFTGSVASQEAIPVSSVANLSQDETRASRVVVACRPAMQPIGTQAPAAFALSPAEIETFRIQGFLGPFTAFEAHEMERAQRIIYDRVLRTPTPYCPFGLRVRHLDSSTVYELCSAPAIVGRMTSLYGPDLILWNSNLFNKPPAEPARPEEYPWHQDHYNWNIEPLLNISAWLAITPATPENGCVEVIPGSHRQIIPSALDTDPRLSLRFGGVASDPAYVDDTKKVALTLEPGQFFLFNERLLHHSNPNRTGAHRLGLAIRVTVPIVKVSEPFPCILLSGEDCMGFNRYVDKPKDEPDVKWLAALPQGHDFVFDRPIPGMGWHLLENDGRHNFAWTGLEPEAWIDFRPVGPGDHLLRFEVIHMLASIFTLRVLVNGYLVTSDCWHADEAVILEARVPNHVLRACDDRVRVTLQGPEPLRPCDLNPASADKRTLGLGIRRISLSPVKD